MKRILRRKPHRPKGFSTRGKHLVIDAYGIEEQRLKNKAALTKLLIDLPRVLKMRIFQKPTVVKIKSDESAEWGLSGFVIIYESHLSFHTWPEQNYVAMDIYSCKNFDAHKATKYLKGFFRAKHMKTSVIGRGQ